MRIFPCIDAGERTHIVRNAEGDEAFELLRIFLEEGIVSPLVFDDRHKLLEMQLVVDCAVVARLQSTKEPLLIEAFHHVGVTLVGLSAGPRKELLNDLLELVVACLMQIVGGIALRLRIAVILGRVG